MTRGSHGGMFIGFVLLAACGGGAGDSASDGGDSSASNTDSPSSAGDGEDGDGGDGTSMSGAADGAEGSAGDDADDGGEPDLGPCAPYIECVMEAMPEAITRAIATYGEEGSCWSLPGVTQENCWTECAALHEALLEIYPEVSACWQCEADEDCQAEESYCGLDHVCGDDIVHCEIDEKGFFAFCRHGLADDIGYLCDPQPLLPGRCSTEGSFGVCSAPEFGWEEVWYEEGSAGGAESQCDSVGGTWIPA